MDAKLTTADIAKRLGCTTQAVCSYRRKLEKRFDKRFGKADPNDGRRTVFTEDEFAQIQAIAPGIPVTESVSAEIVDEGDTESLEGLRFTSLGLSRPTLGAVALERFDWESARENQEALTKYTISVAQRGNSILGAIAANRMAQAAANIDQTIATMEANAIGEAVESLGKRPATGQTS